MKLLFMVYLLSVHYNSSLPNNLESFYFSSSDFRLFSGFMSQGQEG